MVTANPAMFFGFGFGRTKRDAERIEPTPHQRVERLRYEIKGILGLLITATTKRELTSLLDSARGDLSELFTELMKAAFNADPERFEAVLSDPSNALHFAEMDVPQYIAGELNSETLEKLNSVRESYDAFAEWITGFFAEGNKGLKELLLQVQPIDQYADTAAVDASYLIQALALVLDDQIERWTPKSLTVLIDVLDQRLTMIEDAFFRTHSFDDEELGELMSEDEFRTATSN